MTVEYQETRFGKPFGMPKAASMDRTEWLYFNPGLNLFRSIVGRAIRVESEEKIVVTNVLGPLVIPTEYEKEGINNPDLDLTTSPLNSFKDLVLWRRRHYFWKPDNKTA